MAVFPKKLNSEFGNLAKNFSFLTFLTISNFIFPLITFPYLISRLSMDGFGILSFATSFIVYFTLVTEYGFNLTATRDISTNRDDQNKINKIFSTVIYSKIILAIILFIVFLIIVFLIPKLRENSSVFLLSYLSIFGQIFIPIWFFQGIEKMKTISILFFISKLISTILIFVLVNGISDILYVPIINFISFAFISLVAIFICFKYYHIKIIPVSIKHIIDYGKDGIHIFVSNISVALFSTGTITILGFLTNNYIVGYYSAADKIIQAIRSMMNPLSQILFPYLSKLSINEPDKVYKINGKLLKYGSLLFLVFTILLMLLSSFLLKILTETENIQATYVLLILSLVPLISYIHIILAMFTLLVFKKNKEYSYITLTSGVLNLFLSFLMIYYFEAIGGAISIVTIEIFTGIMYVRAIKKNNLKIII